MGSNGRWMLWMVHQSGVLVECSRLGARDKLVSNVIGITSSTTTVMPLSANSCTTFPPMPPAPPVINTISLSHLYVSAVQLSNTPLSR